MGDYLYGQTTDGLTTSLSADAYSSWMNGGSSLGGLSDYGSGIDWSSVTKNAFGLAGAYLQADTAVKLQKAQNGALTYREGQAGYVAQQAPLGFSISPGLLILAGVAVFALMAAKS